MSLLNLRVDEVERIPLNVPFTDRVRPWNELLVWRFGLVEVIRIRTNAAEIVGHGETLPYYLSFAQTEVKIGVESGGGTGGSLGRRKRALPPIPVKEAGRRGRRR